jgi:hypothetical protein
MKALLVRDANGEIIPVMNLSSPQDVDGALASAQSGAITGDLVRICAVNADIRFLIGADPIALTTSHFLPQAGEIWMPIISGYKVAVLGGKANISVAGE